ncbi:MAG: MFS transporter [Chloroflexota bacterium]
MSDSSYTSIQRQNFRNVQIDAIGIGLSSAAAQFLPVFLTRLGASSLEVGLLASMPGVTGLLLAIPVGRFLQTRRNIIPWFSTARLLVISCYAMTGLIAFLAPERLAIRAILAIWAFATLPQIIVAVAFTVVMNAVAGPEHRYDLMSRRWSTLGLTSAITVSVVGQILVNIAFPLNYQLVFFGLSVGGLISFIFSSRIVLPSQEPPRMADGHSFKQVLINYFALLRAHPAFNIFVAKRFVFLFGVAFAAPLFPLYYVRVVHAPDSWIGIINTTATVVMLAGYTLWTRLSRTKGPRLVLLLTTLGVALHPALLSSTDRVQFVVAFAAFAGIFQAGLDLVFFDELMKTVPDEYSATFVSLAQSLQYLSTILAPLVGTYLADQFGLSVALVVGALIRLSGFGLFAWRRPFRRVTPNATHEV